MHLSTPNHVNCRRSCSSESYFCALIGPTYCTFILVWLYKYTIHCKIIYTPNRFRFIFQLVGTATLSVGIWVEVDNQHLFDLTKDVSGSDLSDTDIPSLLENAVIVLIGAGAFIFLLGFLGCCGALQPKTRGGKLFLKIVSACTPVPWCLVHAQARYHSSLLVCHVARKWLWCSCPEYYYLGWRERWWLF